MKRIEHDKICIVKSGEGDGVIIRLIRRNGLTQIFVPNEQAKTIGEALIKEAER